MNWTGQSGISDGIGYGVDFEGAARQQLNWLYNDVPRTDEGAFSHRQDQVQLWCIFFFFSFLL
jgi:hypothetical protein